MRVGVVTFPGTNCDHDLEHVCGTLFGAKVEKIWHREADMHGVDVVFLPGGFSYGDYLRTGALAALSPVMGAIKEFAGRGGPVIGICNGFQILCESGLLPGALLPNSGGTFVSKWVTMRVESQASVFTRLTPIGYEVRCPVAHGDGNYFADAATIKNLETKGQVVLRYKDGNPNGSLGDIAGISNEKGNVVGLMPHPERACEPGLGSDSGKLLFKGLLS